MLIDDLCKYMGVGKEKANELIKLGLKDIKELREKKWLKLLPNETKLWLKIKPKTKIPNYNIRKLEPYLLVKNKKLETYIVGSYRRNEKYSKDIDIMLVNKNNINIRTYIDYLKKIFTVYIYNLGEKKASLVIDVSNILEKKTKTYYKLDIFITTKDNMIPMLLYSTGSKINNIHMRSKAKKLNMKLNQNGIFKNKNGNYIKITGLKTERAYYNLLNIPYKQPDKR